jgi:hypothetical protein
MALKLLNFEHRGFYDLKQGTAFNKIFRLNGNLYDLRETLRETVLQFKTIF